MRTTVLVDDDLGQAARERAREEGVSLSDFVARAIADRLSYTRQPPAATSPFRLITVGAGGTYPGVDLDRTSELLIAEDSAVFGGARDFAPA